MSLFPRVLTVHEQINAWRWIAHNADILLDHYQATGTDDPADMKLYDVIELAEKKLFELGESIKSD